MQRSLGGLSSWRYVERVSVLVTGGAGYIGAHVVRQLVEQGTRVVVVDDLSTGDPQRVSGVPLEIIDLVENAAADRLERVMRRFAVDAVIHFAAKKQVSESISHPVWYYRQNVGGLTNVLDAARSAGVSRFVFSSSAAVYGIPEDGYVDESIPPNPISPYGQTKLIGEWLVQAEARSSGMGSVSLRYFNVAGAGSPDLGDPETLNLVTIVLDRLTRGEPPQIFGADFDTADGYGVRDFVHVADVARAHIDALTFLTRREAENEVFNVGRGVGSSVRDVVDALARVSGSGIEAEVVAPREGDVPFLVANVDRIERELGWRAQFDFDEIIDSAWHAFQRR